MQRMPVAGPKRRAGNATSAGHSGGTAANDLLAAHPEESGFERSHGRREGLGWFDFLPNFSKLRPSLPNEAGGMGRALTRISLMISGSCCPTAETSCRFVR